MMAHYHPWVATDARHAQWMYGICHRRCGACRRRRTPFLTAPTCYRDALRGWGTRGRRRTPIGSAIGALQDAKEAYRWGRTPDESFSPARLPEAHSPGRTRPSWRNHRRLQRRVAPRQLRRQRAPPSPCGLCGNYARAAPRAPLRRAPLPAPSGAARVASWRQEERSPTPAAGSAHKAVRSVQPVRGNKALDSRKCWRPRRIPAPYSPHLITIPGIYNVVHVGRGEGAGHSWRES